MISFQYQWLRDGMAIQGATSSAYEVSTDDVGHTLFVEVTATNAGGSSKARSAGLPIPSAPSAPINTTAPAMNQAIVGQVSSVTNGTWTGTAPIGYAYQWKADGSPIGGATNNTYTPVSGDNGKTLSCVVTAHNAAGTSAATSNGLTVTTSGAHIDIPDAAALAAAKAAWPTTGNKTWRLTGLAAAYGPQGIYGDWRFDSAPIIIDGLDGSDKFEWLEIAGASGITFQNFNVFGQNSSVNAAMWVHSDDVTVMNLTFHNVTTNNTQPMGTQLGGGWILNSLTGSTISITGQNDATKPDIWGREFGVAFTSPSIFAAFSLQNMTIDNNGVNAVFGGGIQNYVINHNLVLNIFYGPGDHPNAFHLFSDANTGSFTNNGVWQGLFGGGPTGFFFESVSNQLVQNNWVLSGGQNGAFSNSAGSNQTNDNNFAQGVGGVNGGVMIARGGAVNSINTNNTVQFLANYAADGVNPGYQPASPPGSNTIIPTYASSVTDATYLDPWLTAHPTARPRPF